MYKTEQTWGFPTLFRLDSYYESQSQIVGVILGVDEVRSDEEGELCVAPGVSPLQPIRKSNSFLVRITSKLGKLNPNIFVCDELALHCRSVPASNHRSFLVCLHCCQFRFQIEIGQKIPLVYFSLLSVHLQS